MQYTPGPWRQTGVNVRAGDALIAFSTDHYADEHLMESEKLANARLIASAPDLLRALEDAEFLLRKVSNNPKEIGSMLDSLKRCAIDAREAIQSAS